MTPSRILPDLQCSLVCDSVRQEANGNLILIGVMHAIRVPQLPVGIFQLFIVNRWTAGKGQFSETVRLVAPDATTVLRKVDSRFQLTEPAHCATTAAVIGQFEITQAGNHWIEVLVDDVMKIRYALPVMLPPPGQAPAQTA